MGKQSMYFEKCFLTVLRASFITFDAQILTFKFLPYQLPKSHARSDWVAGQELGELTSISIRPMPMTSYLTTIGMGSVLPVRGTHTQAVRGRSITTARFTHWVWVVRDLALECRDQKATVNQTQAILTAYSQTRFSAPNRLQLNAP